jgi:MFS family permease
MDLGPEHATVVERLARFLHLPHIVCCFIIAVVIGPPGMILVAYFTAGLNIEHSIFMTVSALGGVGTPYEMGAAIVVLSSVLLFLLLYMTAFMRQILASADQGISPVLPEGETTFHGAFKSVFRWWPPFVVAAPIALFSVISSYDYIVASFGFYTVNAVTMAYLAIVYPLWIIIACIFAWVYFSSIYGLYKLGGRPLRMKSSTEDRMLGVRPFGDLSLSLSTAYFSVMVIMILMGIAATIGSPIIGFVPYMTLLVIFLMVGVVLFVSPLYAVHKKMLEQKEAERNELRKHAYKGVEERTPSSTDDAVAEMQRKLDSLTSLMALEMAEKNLNSIPDWPIDTHILNRFATIMITVIAIVIANLILRLLA